jgi:hypothetical protein
MTNQWQVSKLRLPAKTEPRPMKNQAFTAIQIETLCLQMALEARNIVPLRFAHLFVMRKREALDHYDTPSHRDRFLWIRKGRFVALRKGVKWS